MRSLRRTHGVVLLASILAASAGVAAADEPPERHRLGLYLTALQLHVADTSFDAEFWIWSASPDTSAWDPLATLEVVDASEVEIRHPAAVTRADPTGARSTWRTARVSATLPHPWDVHNYPFDRHTLSIALEESVEDASRRSYEADVAESAVDPSLELEGWTVTGFRLVPSERWYATTFGDPSVSAGSGSSYSRVTALVDLERDSVVGFWKLTAGVYVAFLIGALSFFLDSAQPSLTNPRMSMLVGSVFATLVNLRFVAQSSRLGSESVTLVDRIHVAALLFLFLAAMMAVASRLVSESGEADLARRLDRRVAFALYVVGFAVINVLMVAQAARQG